MISSTTLLIRHLPSELNKNDKEDLLKSLGAIEVRVMPDKGRMRNSAFASFQHPEEARHVLNLLHQREILGCQLTVVYAKEKPILHSPSNKEAPSATANESDKVEKSTIFPAREVCKTDAECFLKKLHGVAPKIGLDYLPSQLLRYNYPPPNSIIIQNICNALVSVPKFYNQVLHLMNKMNLPAPFGPLTPMPPLVSNIEEKCIEMDIRNEEETTSESEYESDKEENGAERVTLKKKPPKPSRPKKKRKLMKVVALKPNAPNLKPSAKQPADPSEVFESQPLSQKKILMKNIDQMAPTIESNIEPCGGFGAIEPIKVDNTEADEEEESEDSDPQVISMEEIRKKRISTREMKTMSLYRGYSSGEPTFRLYIKNLAKQVDEKDLRYIFGKFLNRNSEEDKSKFDIKLMKEGRMKGQAFITLANEKQAAEAVKHLNGFVLHTKPLVVQFARSAKPKEEVKKGKT